MRSAVCISDILRVVDPGFCGVVGLVVGEGGGVWCMFWARKNNLLYFEIIRPNLPCLRLPDTVMFLKVIYSKVIPLLMFKYVPLCFDEGP